jgi:dual-specificity kinase
LKRRRSREPDWKEFYKNGLPKEIIVIDDSPEPEPETTAPNPPPKRITNGITTNGTTNGSVGRHVAKKRKRDDEPLHYDPVYHSKHIGSHTTTPHTNGRPTGSTISTDRTSAIQTTAPTSLSSNSQYEDGLPGQKRKRTRQQLAEAKRREVEVLGDAYVSYQPPPYPPKKAPEVNVRIVHDVSPVRTPSIRLL